MTDFRAAIIKILDEETTAGGTSTTRWGDVNSAELADLILASPEVEELRQRLRDAIELCETVKYDKSFYPLAKPVHCGVAAIEKLLRHGKQ